jgi:hypothetical protein
LSAVLDGLPVGQISAGALVGIIVLLVLVGRLVPRQQLLDSQAREERAMGLAEKWQAVATEHGMTLHQILDAVEDINEIVAAIQVGLARPLDKGPNA